MTAVAANPVHHVSVHDDDVIALRDVSKSFGTLRAVDSVTASIQRGEVVGLIGPNGSGKTTLLRLLAGLASPTAGSVRLFGQPPSQATVRQRVGIALATFPVADRRTCIEIVQHLCRLRQRDDMTRARELATHMSLDLHRRTSELSRGNLQKLSLVQAFMHEPELVLLDEPTAGLDPIVQGAFNDLVASRRESGTTIIMSSHVLESVRSVATRVVAIRSGKVVANGPMTSILNAVGRTVSVTVRGQDAPDLEGIVAITSVRAGVDVDGLDTTTVTGTLYQPPSPLIQRLARCEVTALTIAEPQLGDVVNSLYIEGGDLCGVI